MKGNAANFNRAKVSEKRKGKNVCDNAALFTWHIVEEEIRRSDESGEGRGRIAEGEGEPDGPVDEGADANVEPVLDEDVHRVLRPVDH